MFSIVTLSVFENFFTDIKGSKIKVFLTEWAVPQESLGALTFEEASKVRKFLLINLAIISVPTLQNYD